MANRQSIRTAVLSAVISLLCLAAACGGDSDGGSDVTSGVFREVPQRANAVGTVAAGEALDALDPELRQLLVRLPLAFQEGSELDDLLTIEQFRPGGIFGEISRADFFTELTDGGDDEDYLGAVLRGSFDETVLIAGLESLTGSSLVASVYKGNNVYAPVDDVDEFALSVLDSSTFAIGAGGVVNDIIDIRAGDADPASGALMATLNRLDGSLFALAVEVPENINSNPDLGTVSPLNDLSISLDFISALQIIGISGELDGGSVDLKVELDFADADAATSFEGFMDGIIGLAGGLSTSSGATGLLEDIEVDRDGSRLTIIVGIPLADIPDLFGDMTWVASTETSSSLTGLAPTPEIRLFDSAVGVVIPVERDRDHIPEGQNVEYRTTPPTSGKHWPTPARCGFYSEGLPEERIVHNLEHGNIVVNYNFANPAQVTELRQVLESVPQFPIWGLAHPYDGIPDGQVVLTAWGRMAPMNGVKPGEIELFFETLSGALGPERIPC